MIQRKYYQRRAKASMARESTESWDTVGVRELRQNLSVYLERVKAGEALTVTEHGEEVALLRPLPRKRSPLQRMVAEGRATAPTASVRQLRVPTRTPEHPTREILDELREDRF